MGKEKAFWRDRSFWSFFGLRHAFGFFRRRKTSSAGLAPVRFLAIVGTIAILAAATLIILNPIEQMQKERDDKRKSDLSQIQKVLEQYYRDNGRYPTSSTNYKIVRLDGSTAEWGEGWLPYMAKLPRDPMESNRYAYYSAGQAYYLYAAIERGGKDPQLCNNGNACRSLSATNFPAAGACGEVCNYGVTSANVSP